MTSENGNSTGEEDRRTTARGMVAKAEDARSAGNDDEADRLLDEADRVDPQAVGDALAAEGPHAEIAGEPDAASDADEEVRLMTATVEPHSDAPSRAGITGEGSGADGM